MFSLAKIVTKKQLLSIGRIVVNLENDNLDDFELLEYWRTLPRDTEGRWGKYHQTAPHYYTGLKLRPRDEDDKIFLRSNLKASKFLLESLDALRLGMDYEGFFNWLVEIHKKQSFTPGTEGKLANEQIINDGRHTPVVIDDIVRLARKFGDPYTPTGKQTLFLPEISKKGLPIDEWKDGIVIHKYPNPKYFTEYVSIINRFLTQAAQKLVSPSEDIFIDLAAIYQYGTNSRMFVKTNHSLMLNIVNTFLRELGLRGIESGILDFVAMRLRPENFVRYFIEEVQRVNPDKKLFKLPPSLNSL